MYGAMYLWEDAIDVSIVNAKYQKIGTGGILLLKNGKISGLVHE